ncbi:MAG: citramalate synthase [Acutalibacter sp.]|jgi:2-isopropylmalate synthase
MGPVTIFDSTLRDGAQGTGIGFSLEDKLQAVRLLDQVGIQYVEAGNPGSNPKDEEFFHRVAELPLRHAKLVSFGSTRRKDIRPEEDANLQAILKANTPCCSVFGKCWKFQVTTVLETTFEENLLMIEESCRFLKSHGREVIFDAEHFFDGWKDDKSYAWEALRAAVRGGADIVCLCDTNGGVFPHEAEHIVKEVVSKLDVPVAVHFHEDCGMATANSIVAVQAGAAQIQGTLLGFGERCGNANLSTIIPDLQLKLGISCIPQEEIMHLTQRARELASIANLDLPAWMPYVGENAFAHKAGMHAAGVLKSPRSFEQVDPYLVGNTRRFPASEMSGRAVVLEKIKEVFPHVRVDSQEARELLKELKELESRGYQFEGADASFQLLVRKRLKPFSPFFQLIYYHIYTDYSDGRDRGASATVKVRVGGEIQLMAAEGNGPVNALDQALRKALEIFYPVLSQVKLTDYKVRVLDSKSATAAGVRVLITSTDGEDTFTTVGVSGDVVAASWKALEDSMEYLLLKATQGDNTP